MKGEFFADLNEETGLYCVFHTDVKPGHAFSSWSSMQDAEKDAKNRNDYEKEKEDWENFGQVIFI
jgi:hemolysin-activating ACP:hemolysin acyltransferase